MRFLWALLIVTMLVACQPALLQDNPSTQPPILLNNTQVVPDIPRTHNPGEDNTIVDNPPEEEPHGQVFLTDNTTAGVSLTVPINNLIGKEYPVLTLNEFGLLHHPVIRVSQNRVLGYKEEILLDNDENSTGRIIFGKDDVTNKIDTYLFFEKGKTIFTYGLFLNDLTFKQIEGRDIQVLGHTYVIAEATNKSVTLFGRDVENNFLFDNGKRLKSNSKNWQDTLSRVGPNWISFSVIAGDIDGDGILLSKNETLSQNIGRDILGSQLLDIRYGGAVLDNLVNVHLVRTRFGYKITYDRVDGTPLTFNLVETDAGKIFFGTLKDPIKIARCTSQQPYCLQVNDNILFKSRHDMNYLLSYTGLSNQSKDIWFRDSNGGIYQFPIVGDVSRNAWADVILDDTTFRVRIQPSSNVTEDLNISIDQGFTYDNTVELVTRGGFRIRFHPFNRTMLPLELVIPRQLTQTRRDEISSINLTYSNDAWTYNVGGNLTIIQNQFDDNAYALSQYGVEFVIDKNRQPLPLSVGQDLDILIPTSTLAGIVRFEG